MGDELEGPYKVLQRINPHPQQPTYSIILQKKRENFFKMYIPNAGDGETARQVCNLLNKEFKRVVDELERDDWGDRVQAELDRRGKNDSTDGFDVAGVRYPD